MRLHPLKPLSASRARRVSLETGNIGGLPMDLEAILDAGHAFHLPHLVQQSVDFL